MEQKGRVFALAILFESSLGFAGVGIAWLAGIVIIDRLQLTQTAFERGLIATLNTKIRHALACGFAEQT